MKVSKAIEMLSKNYSPDDELVIMWWDKEIMANDDKVSDEAMAYAEGVLEDDEWLSSSIYNTIREAIAEFHKEEVAYGEAQDDYEFVRDLLGKLGTINP